MGLFSLPLQHFKDVGPLWSELGQILEVRSIILPSLQKPDINSRVLRSPILLINWLQIQGFPVLPKVL